MLAILLEKEASRFGRILGRKQAPIIAANAAQRAAFGADDAAIRESRVIDAVIFFGAVAPAIHVVVADDVELGKKLRLHGIRGRLRGNAVACSGYRARGVLAMKNAEQLAKSFSAVGRRLIANLVSGAP